MACKIECSKCLRYLAETEAHLVNIASAFEADGLDYEAAIAASKALDDLALLPFHGTDREALKFRLYTTQDICGAGWAKLHNHPLIKIAIGDIDE